MSSRTCQVYLRSSLPYQRQTLTGHSRAGGTGPQGATARNGAGWSPRQRLLPALFTPRLTAPAGSHAGQAPARTELGAGQHPPSHGKGGRAASVVQATGRRTCCERSWTDSRSPRTGHASSLPAGNAFLSGPGQLTSGGHWTSRDTPSGAGLLRVVLRHCLSGPVLVISFSFKTEF